MASFAVPAFYPETAATKSIAATSSSSTSVQLQTGNAARHCRIWNAGTVTVFVEFASTASATASATASMPIGAGVVQLVSAPVQYVAAVTAAGAATVYFTLGEGNS